MTTETRTDEELNRIIAEWCGWVWQDKYVEPNSAYDAHWEHKDGTWSDDIPNYCRDMSAVHDACQKLFDILSKKWIGGSLADDYDVEIQRMSVDKNTFRWDHDARQRAEALVKVIEAT